MEGDPTCKLCHALDESTRRLLLLCPLRDMLRNLPCKEWGLTATLVLLSWESWHKRDSKTSTRIMDAMAGAFLCPKQNTSIFENKGSTIWVVNSSIWNLVAMWTQWRTGRKAPKSCKLCRYYCKLRASFRIFLYVIFCKYHIFLLMGEAKNPFTDEDFVCGGGGESDIVLIMHEKFYHSSWSTTYITDSVHK